MTCKQVYDLVMAYLDNELSTAERADFEHHLFKCCPSCGAYLESYKETVRLARAAGRCPSQDDVPPKLLQAILACMPKDNEQA
jgi:anti-sigma factor RsiW